MNNPVDPIAFSVVVIEGELISDIDEDQKAAGNSEPKSEDIDCRITFLVKQISPRDLQVIFIHSIAIKESLLYELSNGYY